MAENKINETMDENAEEIVMLTDEDGNEHAFALIAEAALNGTQYYALIPADGENDDEFCEYIILKMVEEDGEENLVSIDDDEEFDTVADYFDDLFSEEFDYDSKGENK
jgi:uncharacterized protein YrzB (UPF0473 family)